MRQNDLPPFASFVFFVPSSRILIALFKGRFSLCWLEVLRAPSFVLAGDVSLGIVCLGQRRKCRSKKRQAVRTEGRFWKDEVGLTTCRCTDGDDVFLDVVSMWRELVGVHWHFDHNSQVNEESSDCEDKFVGDRTWRWWQSIIKK
jgi:hypothetical protein